MYWQEQSTDKPFQVPDDIVDLSFQIDCLRLPLDHAHALSKALLAALPWLASEQDAGIHSIHGAASGNGWYRPEDPTHELLHLSRRTRMVLRLPKHRVKDATQLTGQTLDVAGYPLTVGKSSVRALSTLGTLFSRYVVAQEDQDEDAFLQSVVAQLQEMQIPTRRLLCGKSNTIRTPDGPVFTRSVMIADLSPERSVQLQQKGLGPGRQLGCGIFIPHKGIDPVRPKNDD